jgi:periplasmic protein TonB
MKRFGSERLLSIKLLSFSALMFLVAFFTSCSNNSQFKESKEDSVNLAEIKRIEQEEKNNSSSDKASKESKAKAYESFAIDEKPIFPGGDEGLTDYVTNHIIYPKESKKKGIQGTVYVRFVVTKTGAIGETDIMRTVDPLLEMEALRIVKSLPKWTPGKKNGNTVDVWFIIPIKFKLK